jgi:hypothetical protein
LRSFLVARLEVVDTLVDLLAEVTKRFFQLFVTLVLAFFLHSFESVADAVLGFKRLSEAGGALLEPSDFGVHRFDHAAYLAENRCRLVVHTPLGERPPPHAPE